MTTGNEAKSLDTKAGRSAARWIAQLLPDAALAAIPTIHAIEDEAWDSGLEAGVAACGQDNHHFTSLAAAKAEGAREAVERIREHLTGEANLSEKGMVRAPMPLLNAMLDAVLHEKVGDERESSLGRDTEAVSS